MAAPNSSQPAKPSCPRRGNISRARDLLSELAALGLRDVCVCAGARNAPFVAALEGARDLTALPFFEERSAAFFALGRARRDACPVAVVVTSGTAAAELLPATIEAHYSGVPLVLITADRPRRMRGTGAPQAIEQVGLFQKFVALERDLEGDDEPRLEEWDRRGPIHLNICLDEPLLDEKPLERSAAWRAAPPADLPQARSGTSAFLGSRPSARGLDPRELSAVANALLRARRPLAIASGVESASERAAIKALLLRLQAPVYAEATSGLREDLELAPLLLRSGDRALAWAMRRGLFDCVLRLGNVPTARLWRDLEAPSCAIPVVSLGSLPFTGLSRGVHCWGDVAALAPALATGIEPRPGEAEFLRGDAERALGLDRALRDLPHSEPGMIAALSRLMSAEASVYLGNSSPIREWDLAADRARPRWAQASRGANGIDGQISTFLGGVRQGRDAWAIIGDLTALYDLAAPWALPFLPSASVRVAVVNNGGGKIFSRIFGSELFENRHSLRFDHFAKAWGVSYERWASIPQSPVAAAVSRPDRPIDRADGRAAELIEILPNEAETAEFWLRYDSLWQEA